MCFTSLVVFGCSNIIVFVFMQFASLLASQEHLYQTFHIMYMFSILTISISVYMYKRAVFLQFILYTKTYMLNNVIIIKTSVLLPQAYVALTDFGYSIQILWLPCSRIVPKQIIWLSSLSILGIADEDYSRNSLFAPCQMSTF